MAELVASEKNGKRSSLKKLPPRIDFTAMVDLAFLLITFFILTTSLNQPKRMDLTMPVGPAGPVGESSTMTICLGKYNKVLCYLGMPERPLSTPVLVDYGKTGLRQTITNMKDKIFKSTGKPMMVVLKPSNHSLYDNLINTLDELNIANVPSYAIADISSKDIDMLKQKNAY
ncbi:MAG TPA: biopolymer transporter ExbD [Mucilaginibacter sp.]|nr:biopolymer transporter ExbD [Mucilaginibacter sp.]